MFFKPLKLLVKIDELEQIGTFINSGSEGQLQDVSLFKNRLF